MVRAMDKSLNRWLSFSRSPHKMALIVFIAPSVPDLKVEMNERCLLFERKNLRLNLNLEKFLVIAITRKRMIPILRYDWFRLAIGEKSFSQQGAEMRRDDAEKKALGPGG
jgi:hypothetical protein